MTFLVLEISCLIYNFIVIASQIRIGEITKINVHHSKKLWVIIVDMYYKYFRNL